MNEDAAEEQDVAAATATSLHDDRADAESRFKRIKASVEEMADKLGQTRPGHRPADAA